MIQQIAAIEQEQRRGQERVQQIPLARLLPSATQPRTIFEPVAMAEMVESVREHGIIQPLIVRLREDGGIEIVDGERRWRAAKEAGLDEAPVIFQVREGYETLEVQLIANLQREDLTPKEEAAGYKRLLDLRDEAGAQIYSVDKIAKAVGKNRTRIHWRLKLLRIPKSVSDALDRKLIGSDLAEMIGALPAAELRESAAEQILKPTYGVGPMERDAAREFIKKNFMRDLRAAPFDQNDESLVPVLNDGETGERIGGGACLDCPMRSGNMPEGSPKRPDVCTNPRCYVAKVDAHWARVHAGASADGPRLLTTEEAAEIFDEEHRVRFDSEFVDMAQQPDRGIVRDDVAKVPTWKRLLADLPVAAPRPEMVVARDARGRVRELVDQSAAMEAVNLAAKQAGEKSIFDRSAGRSRESGFGFGGSTADAAENKAEAEAKRKEQKLAFDVKKATMGALVEAIAHEGMRAGFWKALVEIALVHAGHDGQWFACKRLNLEPASSKIAGTNAPDYGAPLRDYAAALIDDDDALAFVVELLLGKAFKSLGAEDRSFQLFADLYELDLRAIEKETRTGEVAEQRPASNAASEAVVARVPPPPGGKVEHHWVKDTVARVFRCTNCPATGEQIGMSWPPVVDAAFLEKPCVARGEPKPEAGGNVRRRDSKTDGQKADPIPTHVAFLTIFAAKHGDDPIVKPYDFQEVLEMRQSPSVAWVMPLAIEEGDFGSVQTAARQAWHDGIGCITIAGERDSIKFPAKTEHAGATCSRNDCKRPAREGRKMCEECAEIVRKAQQKKRGKGGA